MKRKLGRALVAVLIAGGAAWWLWPAGPRPWRVVRWADSPDAIQFTPDGRSLVAGDRGVTVVPVAPDDPPGSGRVLPDSDRPRGPTLSGRPHPDRGGYPDGLTLVSPDGLTVLAGHGDASEGLGTEPASLRVWDLPSGTIRATLTLPINGSTRDDNSSWDRDEATVCFAEHGRLIRFARQTENSEVIVSTWEAATGRPLPETVIPGCQMHPDPFRDDGRALVVYNAANTRLIISDLRTGQWRAALDLIHCEGKPGEFTGAKPSHDGRFVISATSDQSVQFWDAGLNHLIREYPYRPSQTWEPPIHPHAISPDGRSALMAGTDGSAQVWDVEQGKVLRTIPDDPDYSLLEPRCVFSPDGRILALVELPVPSDPIWARARRFGSSMLARVGAPNLLGGPGSRLNEPIRVRFLEVRTGRIVAPGINPVLQVDQVVFRPDGRALAVHGRVWWLDGPKFRLRTITTLWDVPAFP